MSLRVQAPRSDEPISALMLQTGVLPTRLVEKVWGREALLGPFMAPAGQRIGEIWSEPPSEVPQVLVKYLFTNEKARHLEPVISEFGQEVPWT